MVPGGGKQKGAEFERQVCVKLSLWVTNGASKDCFWRSAMSGGRATVHARKGVKLSRQAGDVCAVSPEGHVLTNLFYIETKHYRSLDPARFLFGEGLLANFWRVADKDARQHGRVPMLIAKENLRPILLLTRAAALEPVSAVRWISRVRIDKKFCDVYKFDEVIALPFKASL